MRCRQVKGLLPAHFNKELSEADHRTLEAHLAACPACHAHWSKLYRADRWLMEAAQRAQSKRGPSVDFTVTVMASIVARQQQSVVGQASEITPARQLQHDQDRSPVILPLGPWFGWEANPLGAWNPSPRMLLSSVLLVLVPVMVAVVVLGVLLTQPVLATQVVVGMTTVLANLVAGVYSFVGAISALADNQLLLAGVAAGYVSLALLWFRLMRHPGREEVES